MNSTVIFHGADYKWPFYISSILNVNQIKNIIANMHGIIQPKNFVIKFVSCFNKIIKHPIQLFTCFSFKNGFQICRHRMFEFPLCIEVMHHRIKLSGAEIIFEILKYRLCFGVNHGIVIQLCKVCCILIQRLIIILRSTDHIGEIVLILVRIFFQLKVLGH